MQQPRMLLVTLALSGCATTAASPEVKRAAAPRVERAPSASGSASGVWDWLFRTTDEHGDMRVEQEEWHLSQHGATVDGYYDRLVTMMSTDDRLYRCNQRLGFTRTTRVRLLGQIHGDHIELQEVAFEATPGPCDDGARNLVAYTGVLRGGTLMLKWGPEAGQTLVRRAELRPPLAGPTVASAEHPALPRTTPASGVWTWEIRSIDSEGDERLEREEWHIDETSDGIKGYYDRTVARVRGDGSQFTCNGQPRLETTTRYKLSGHRYGDKLTLTETDYQAAHTDCDNGLRRLDTYQGHLSDGDTLILSWGGAGNQLLKRKK